MKKLILPLLSVLFTFVGQAAYSQIRWGIKGGISLTTTKFMPPPDGSFSIQWGLRENAGLLSEFELNKKLYVRTELLYSVKGWGLTEGNVGPKVKTSVYLKYLSLPLLLGYRPMAKLSVLVGPEFNHLLKITDNRPGDIEMTYYKKFDIALTLGATYLLTSKLGLELRYAYGLKPIYVFEMTDFEGHVTLKESGGYNRALQLGLFYCFGRGDQ